jgi:ferredoxin
MRIVVDRDLCQGHGTCCAEAPDVFALDADGQVRVMQDEPGEALHDAIRKAVKYCPTAALRLVD